jgi:ABC-type polysaccharide/polyol phosphate transport system ATPase subunit
VAHIKIENVSVELPVYDGIQRSLKRELLNAGTGGRISRDRKNHVFVEALRDVSLEVKSGDRVALIGRNGAGKTTLLRLMAGICEPTRGQVYTEGRISTLFDVSSIMDPEMTGYENIDYASSILGMERRNLKELYRDVAEFTELGDYLHMPVRTYSSGMMVKLSFAIITSVEPEILLLDEALGAGDAHFVDKAQRRSESLYERSSIVVMASHSSSLLRQLCHTAVWLDRGDLVRIGPIDEVLDAYEKGVHLVPTSASA